MTPLAIRADDLKRVRDLLARQDQHAHAIGVLEVEFWASKRKLVSAGGALDLAALGALHVEHEQRFKAFIRKVEETEAAQRLCGEDALRVVGVDPDAALYSMDHTNGLVLKWIGEKWELVEVA